MNRDNTMLRDRLRSASEVQQPYVGRKPRRTIAGIIMKLSDKARPVVASEQGATAVEYAVILIFLFIAIMVPVRLLKAADFRYVCQRSGGTVQGTWPNATCKLPVIPPSGTVYDPSALCFGPQCVPDLGGNYNGGGSVDNSGSSGTSSGDQQANQQWHNSDGQNGHDQGSNGHGGG